MRRRWKILLVVVLALAVLALAAAIAAPLVARAKLVAALRQAGYPAASVERVRLGLGGATVHGLTVVPQALAVERIDVTWQLTDLLHGKIERVAVAGVAVDLEVGPAGPDLAPLLPQPGAEPAAPATAPGQGGDAQGAPSGWPTTLPLTQLALDGVVTLHRGALREPCTLALTATHLGGGEVHVGGTLGVVDGRITIDAILAGRGKQVHASLDGLAGERLAALLLPDPVPPAGGQPAGQPAAEPPPLPALTIGGTVHWDGALTADLAFAGLGGALAVRGTWNPQGATGGSLDLTDLDLATLVTTAGPWLPPLPVRGLAGRVGGQLHIDQAAAGWALEGTVAVRGLTATHEQGKGRAKLVRWTGRATTTALAAAAPGALPATIGALRIEDAQVTVDGLLRGGALTVSVPELTATDDGMQLGFHGRVLAAGASAEVAGESDRTGQRIDARVLATDLDLAAWSAWVPVELPVTVAGTAALNLRVIRLGDAIGGTATLNGEKLAIADPTGEWRFTAAEAGIDGGFNLSDRQVVAHAATRVAGGALEAPGMGVAVSGLDGTFPVSVGDDPGLTGDLIGTLAAGGYTEPIRLRARLVDHKLYGRVDARLLNLLPASAEGVVDFSPGGLAAHLAIGVQRAEISDPDALAKAVPQLAGWQVAGTLTAAGSLDLRNGAVVPDLRLRVEDATVGRPADGWKVEGAAIAPRLSGTEPWRTLAATPFSATRCTWRDQVVTALSGQVAVDGDRVAVHDLTLGWGGGRVGAPAVAVDLAAKRLVGEFTAERVGLDAILGVAAPGQVSGAGTLAGHLPVTLGWDELHVTLGDGELRADPPDGWVRITDRARVASLIGPGGTFDGKLRERLVDAVRDFRFTSFSLITSHDPGGDLLARVQVAGIGREGPDPLELGGLVFNIRGLEAMLNQALRLQGQGAAPAAPAKDDTLDRFFGP